MIKREYFSSEIKQLIDKINKIEHTGYEAEEMEDFLRRAVKGAVLQLSLNEGRKVLKTIPIEEINSDKSGIRTGLLKENGLATVYDVYMTETYRIACIHGIGENMALKAKNIADRIAMDICNHVKIRLSADNRTNAHTQLVMNVDDYLRAADCIRRCKELSSKLPAGYITELKKIRRASNSIKWFFTPEKKKIEAIDSYNGVSEQIASLDYNPLYNELKAIQPVTEDVAWEDFSSNSVAFYNVLEDLVPEHFKSNSDGYGLSTEIMDEVRNTDMDLTGLKCQLRGYQVWGVKYILRQKRVLLGDEMGLGKTIQALAAMVSLRNEGATHFLVICPASVIINWCREIRSKSDLEPIKIHSVGRALALEYWKQNGGVAVTNYESLSGTMMLEDDFKISMVVVDEAHYIKNSATKRSRNVRAVCTHTDRVLFMTGTPLENRVEEMVRLLGFLQPEVANRAKGVSTTAYAENFKERISPVYYRRKRDDVLAELPDLIQIQEWCDMTKEDEEQYVKDLMNGTFMEARRVSWRNPDYLNTSSKVMRLREIVAEASEDGRKIIVFSFFLDTLDKIAAIFGEQCIGVINGSVPVARRQEIIDTFNSAPPGSILASQIQSGGQGLNIQAASVVIICEPQYKPSAEMQAISRTYRMGQTRNVIVHRLLCANTIEERMIQILWGKQEEFNTFADESVAAQRDMELDSTTINSIMNDEIRRIREKYTEDQIKLLTG